MTTAWRRARPLLGTLVEIGACGAEAAAAVEAAFALVAQLQAQLSRFEAGSEIARFNALPCGEGLAVGAHAQAVLGAARHLHGATAGRFDITLGRGGDGWTLDGPWLAKRSAGVTLDLGGIAKGHAVDIATECLRAHGCGAGWVNAGGDLRAYGDLTLWLQLRDEAHGGTRPWGRLQDGACATSCYGAGCRSRLAGGVEETAGAAQVRRHLSVLAPCCLWADALTKVAALDRGHPVMRELGARVVWH